MSAHLCPICRRPTTPEFRPFCSRRCADVDLQRWFSGAYAVPAIEAEGDDAQDAASPPGRFGTDPL